MDTEEIVDVIANALYRYESRDRFALPAETLEKFSEISEGDAVIYYEAAWKILDALEELKIAEVVRSRSDEEARPIRELAKELERDEFN